MPKYNPNSIWDSKRKQPVPAEDARPPAKPAAVSAPAGAPAEAPAREPFFKKTLREQFDDEPEPKSHAVLWAVVIFVVLLGGGLFYFFFFRVPTGPNVSIGFTKPDQVLVGDSFTFSVSLSNYSQNILKDAALSVFLPDNVSFVGQSPSQRVMEQTVGDLGPGSINKHDFTLIVTGDPSSVKHVDAKLTYSTDAAPKTQFETDGGADLIVGNAAITLIVNPPTGVFSGQDFDTTVTYHNNTSHSFQNVELAMQYPPVYSFTRSTVAPDSSGNNSWDLGTLPAAASGTIIITGNIVGSQDATYAFAGGMTGEMGGETYVLTSQTANVAIGAAPLSLTVALNNSSTYMAGLNDSLNYVLTYTNGSNVTFQNVTLKAALVGSMFDFSTLQSNGSFSSVNNTVTWYAANTPQLLNLAPGQSGSVTLQIRTKSSYPIRLLSDKNYALDVNATVSSPTVPPGTAASSTVSAVSVENKVMGNIAVAAKGYWRDTASGIVNSGPYPPKVNQTTQYTVHWIITNYATDATNTVVTATLQSGTTCTGQIKSNMPTSPTCDVNTGMVRWAIPTVPATTGITGPPAEAIIQVENTPAVNQVGNTVMLLGPTTLQATDAFTGLTLTASAGAVTTDLPDDASISPGQNRRVTQ